MFYKPDECGLDFSGRPPSPPPPSSIVSSPSSSSSSSFHPFFLVRNYADPTSSVLRFLAPPGRKANFSANQAGQASKINVGTPRMEPIDVVFRDVPLGQVSIRSLRKQTRLSIDCCLVFTRRKHGAFFFPSSRPGKIDFTVPCIVELSRSVKYSRANNISRKVDTIKRNGNYSAWK